MAHLKRYNINHLEIARILSPENTLYAKQLIPINEWDYVRDTSKIKNIVHSYMCKSIADLILASPRFPVKITDCRSKAKMDGIYDRSLDSAVTLSMNLHVITENEADSIRSYIHHLEHENDRLKSLKVEGLSDDS